MKIKHQSNLFEYAHRYEYEYRHQYRLNNLVNKTVPSLIHLKSCEINNFEIKFPMNLDYENLNIEIEIEMLAI